MMDFQNRMMISEKLWSMLAKDNVNVGCEAKIGFFNKNQIISIVQLMFS